MFSRNKLPQILSQTGLFRDQPPAVLVAIADAMQEARFAPGSLIFARGDPGDALYLMLEGRVRISILTPDGRELSFTHALANHIFGEIALLDGLPRSANATALSEVTTLCVSRQAFNRLVDSHGSLARAVIRGIRVVSREVV